MTDSEYQEWLALAEADVLPDVLASDSVNIRLELVSFVSSSKGRDRKRVHPVEVDLVVDKASGAGATWDKFPFDVYATEVLPFDPPDEACHNLMRRLQINARK